MAVRGTIDNFKSSVVSDFARPNLFQVDLAFPTQVISNGTGLSDLGKFTVRAANLPSAQTCEGAHLSDLECPRIAAGLFLFSQCPATDLCVLLNVSLAQSIPENGCKGSRTQPCCEAISSW